MSIDEIEQLYKAKVSSPVETAQMHGDMTGFYIPEYQRSYSWSEDDVERLFSDCLYGFDQFSKKRGAPAFTFLGTLILKESRRQESSFTGQSIEIVDGQQRLTTLTLLACALCEEINNLSRQLEEVSLKNDIRGWLEDEIIICHRDLLKCAIGKQELLGENGVFPFPRIIRSEDTRGKSPNKCEYLSPVAKFLMNFSKYVNRNNTPFVPFSHDDNADQTDEEFKKEADKIKDSYNFVKKIVKNISDPSHPDCKNLDRDTISIDKLNQGYYKELFNQLESSIGQPNDIQRAINKVASCAEIHNLIRVLLFSSYLSRCVVLARIVIKDEDAAFDIFDALNSTGQPLTALETLKPLVMQYEEEKKSYKGSPSQHDMKRIGKVLDPLKPHKKQIETKDLIILFALYIIGKKIDGKLSEQRSFLRKLYDQAKKHSHNTDTDYARKFISSIADLNDFKKKFWKNKKAKLSGIGGFRSDEDTNTVKLCISLIRGMNTSLVLPILARYWEPKLEEKKRFVDVIKIVTAFLVLRRSATGKTEGIDEDFRSIMAQTGVDSYGLCVGIKHDHELLSPRKLRSAFKEQLKKKLGISRQSKSKWVNRVAEQPLYKHSRDLARFLIIAAAHQSFPSEESPGIWERGDVIPGTHSDDFLTFKTWLDHRYNTVEHIAPIADSQDGAWDDNIYKYNLHHSLGNLTLLPNKINSAIGNSSWIKKRVLYKALTVRKKSERTGIIKEAEDAKDQKLSKYIKDEIEKMPCLDLIIPLRDVQDWDRDVVMERGRNTAKLAWETISPWLFDED